MFICVSTIGLFVMPYVPPGVGHKSLCRCHGARQGEDITEATGAPTAMSPHRRRKAATMSDVVDERKYAWRMIHAARATHGASTEALGSDVCRNDVVKLLDQALDAGLDRVEIIVELADLGARMFALCNPCEATDPVVVPTRPDDAEGRDAAIRMA